MMKEEYEGLEEFDGFLPLSIDTGVGEGISEEDWI